MYLRHRISGATGGNEARHAAQSVLQMLTTMTTVVVEALLLLRKMALFLFDADPALMLA